MSSLAMKVAILMALLCHTQRTYGTSQHQHKRESPIKESLIIGGSPVSISQYPFMAHLIIKRDHITRKCEGAIITDRYVLTAENCLSVLVNQNKTILIIVGSTNINKPVSSYNSTISYSHPSHYYNTTPYDLGLVYTDTPIVFGPNVKPVQLPNANYNLLQGETITVLGWGETTTNTKETSSVLRAVKVTVLDFTTCQLNYRKKDILVSRVSFCAGDSKGACASDVGGPAINSKGVIVGVASTALKCGNPQSPTIFAVVARMRDFINETAGI